MKRYFNLFKICAAALCACMFLSACTGSQTPLYPIKTLPDEVKQTSAAEEVKVINGSSDSNGKLDFDKTNEVLGKYKFNIYYDNSQGCFMSYATMGANSDMKSVFQKTMRSFRSAFDCGESYKSFTTQGDSKTGKLVWKNMPKNGNIFDDYANYDIYTPTWSGYDYAPDKSPMIMWLDAVEADVKKGESGGNVVSVYMSDLNENNGALAGAGTRVKQILNSAPEGQLDFLILSYVLPYTGSISGYSIDKDGNSQDKDVTYEVTSMQDRYFYAVAFGPHEALGMLDHKIKEGFSELEKNFSRKLNCESYMYRDIFYGTKETVTLDKNDQQITDSEIVKNNPVTYTLNDGKGTPVEKKESPVEEPAEPAEENADDAVIDDLSNSGEPGLIELSDDLFAAEGSGESADENNNGDDIFGENSSKNQILPNLEELSESGFSELFSEKAGENTYAFKYVLPTSGNEWKCGVTLDNTTLYDYDTNNAVSFIYVPKGNGKDITITEEQEDGWLGGTAVSDRNISVAASSDDIIVGSEEALDSTKLAVSVSVPVVLKYKQVVSYYEIKKVDQTFIDWVNRCNVPDRTEKGKEYEKLTHTLFFDEFIDKITDGYKNISETGQKKLVKTDDPQEFSSVVSRVNIIVAADPKTCSGMI